MSPTSGSSSGSETGDDDPEIQRIRAVVESRLLGTPEAATLVGRFIVIERIGAGGMGVVYSAFDPKLDRKVAIKLLSGGDDTERLLGEAKALAKLAHPNVVSVFEVGEHRGRVFVAMEYVRGRTLRRWVTEQRRGWRETLAMCMQAGRGLAAAHAAGVVHRDFKPDNVLVGEDDRARVVDFGLARHADRVAQPRPIETVDSSDDAALTKLTRTGALVGTPAYMAPEQIRGETVDARADQFAFCIAVWEALAGQRPFAGDTAESLFDQVTRGVVQDPPRSLMPGKIESVLRRGLMTDASLRYASMDALLAALDRAARRRSAAGAAALGLLAVGVVGAFALRSEPRCGPAAERIAEIWNEPTRARVHVAFGMGEGADAAAGAVDDWAAAWTDAYDANCASLDGDEPNAEAEVRETCLSLRLEELGGLLDVVGGLQPGEAANLGASWINGVMHPVSCARAFALSTPPPPEDPDVAAEVAALQFEAVRIFPLSAVGRNDEAVAAGEALLERAREVEWPCAEALGAERLGRALLNRGGGGDHARAEQVLLLASKTATSCGDRRLAIESNAALGVLLGGMLEQTGRARGFADRALAELEAYGDDTGLSDTVHYALAMVARSEGDADAAVEHALRLSARSPMQVQLLAQTGRYDEALAVVDAHAREPVSAFGLGPSSAAEEVAWAYSRAIVALGRGELAVAESELERARAAAGPGTPAAADLEVELALLRARSGDSCDSIDAVPRWSSAYGCMHQLAWHVSDVQLACGDLDAARAEFKREVDDCSTRFGRSHRGLAKPLTGLGRVLLAENMPEVARLPLDRALAIVAEHRGPPANDAETRFAAAQAMWDGGGDPLEALTLALAALAGYASLAEGFAPQREEIAAWLATRAESPPHRVAPPRASETPLRACSEESHASATLEVVNETDNALDLYWVDQACQEFLYRTIAPGNSWVQGTFRRHVWRVRDASDGVVLLDVPPLARDEIVRVTTALER